MNAGRRARRLERDLDPAPHDGAASWPVARSAVGPEDAEALVSGDPGLERDPEREVIERDRSAGSVDGLERDGRNENRGAESTLAALSTFQQARRHSEPVRR